MGQSAAKSAKRWLIPIIKLPERAAMTPCHLPDVRMSLNSLPVAIA
jgi:hypothetical protein